MRRYVLFFEPDTVERLKRVARRQACERDQQVSWCDLIRQAAMDILTADFPKDKQTSDPREAQA